MRSEVTSSRIRSSAIPILIALVCAVLAVLAARDPRWHGVLDYRRDAIAGGGAWRLLTAHLMHLSIEHAVLDIVGMLLVAWIFSATFAPRAQLLVLMVGTLAVDVGLWFAHPEVDRYVGLSGLLHAWFAAGAAHWLLLRSDRAFDPKRAWGAALLVGMAAKLLLEHDGLGFWLHGTPLVVVTAAHRWGAAGGLLYAVVARVVAGAKPPSTARR